MYLSAPPTLPFVRLAFSLFFAGLLLVGTTSPAPPSVSDVIAPADTLRLSVRSGDPLVTLLPGGDELTFRALRAPALSWLVGPSFYWHTLAGERGREFVLVERRRGDVVRDTLVLVIDVGPQ